MPGKTPRAAAGMQELDTTGGLERALRSHDIGEPGLPGRAAANGHARSVQIDTTSLHASSDAYRAAVED